MQKFDIGVGRLGSHSATPTVPNVNLKRDDDHDKMNNGEDDHEHSDSVSQLFKKHDTIDDEDENEDESENNKTSQAGETLYGSDSDIYNGKRDQMTAALAAQADKQVNEPVNTHETPAGPTNGVGIIGSLDENKYQQWTEKQVLIWLKENLLNNGLNEDKAKRFLKEFAKMSISGGTLYALKSNNNNEFERLKNEFSYQNQAIGIWMVVQCCIQNIGDNSQEK